MELTIKLNPTLEELTKLRDIKEMMFKCAEDINAACNQLSGSQNAARDLQELCYKVYENLEDIEQHYIT